MFALWALSDEARGSGSNSSNRNSNGGGDDTSNSNHNDDNNDGNSSINILSKEEIQAKQMARLAALENRQLSSMSMGTNGRCG